MCHQFNNVKHCSDCKLLQEYFLRTSTVMTDFFYYWFHANIYLAMLKQP
jgi:hypothetical protein